MNEKTKTNEATATLYRVNYFYVANNGQIRSGSLAANATTIEEAKKKGSELLATFGLNNPKVTGAKPY